MSLLIKNGEIVTATEQFRADIYCADEQITEVGPGLTALDDTVVVDATGKYVFPGFIDPHVHVYLPLKPTGTSDTYETASRAALVGGTTCFIDFCSPERDEMPLDALKKWDHQSEGKSACDFSYHMAVSTFSDRIREQLEEVANRGITSLKIYLAYKDSVGISDQDLRQVLSFAARNGLLTLGHCEDAEAIARLQQQLLAEGRTGPEWHYYSRPPEIEAMGTRHFLRYAADAKAHAYIVHLSCEEALREAISAGGLGERVWIETLISFLVLDKTFAELSDFEAAKYIVSPPLREKKNQEALWRALADGTISTLSTDHAPFNFDGQKTLGREAFTKIPNGMPTIQDRVNLLYTHGVKEGRITLNRFVEVASTAAAEIFGLYPRKGTIQVGSDADLVVYDPDYSGVISAATHLMNVDYNPFEGWKTTGRPDVVTVRGKIAVKDGVFVGDTGRGQFIPRTINQRPTTRNKQPGTRN